MSVYKKWKEQLLLLSSSWFFHWQTRRSFTKADIVVVVVTICSSSEVGKKLIKLATHNFLAFRMKYNDNNELDLNKFVVDCVIIMMTQDSRRPQNTRKHGP
jgi:hypothetical protein